MSKRSTISLEDLKNTACAKIPANRKLLEQFCQKKDSSRKKKSKYGNSKKEVDGIVFDSTKEANRYGELKLLLKAGVIGMLELQVPFELNEGGSYSLRYIADFVYSYATTGEKIVEDAKGHRTREYIRKRKLMKKVHGIIIKET